MNRLLDILALAILSTVLAALVIMAIILCWHIGGIWGLCIPIIIGIIIWAVQRRVPAFE